jgi:hypothetical protein
MSNYNKSFHPLVIIADHFDEVINKIDIKTETLLLDQSLTRERVNELNKARQEQIDKIKEIEKLNLSKHGFNLSVYEDKWSFLINDASLNFAKKIDKIKRELISVDCLLLENPKTLNGLNLWITSEFYDKKNIKFLK